METPRGIAIIGMACRFPGAPDLDAFWDLLSAGREGIRRFTPDELRAAGVPDEVLADPGHVPAAPVIADHDRFDAGYFAYSPREARVMDPQQRLLLQTAVHALEDAGLDPSRSPGPTGAFMGAGGVVSSYLLAQAALHQGSTGGLEHLGNDKDFLATRLSYKLGLTGPSLSVQTACSTSLVAVHLARQSILDGECRVALAGAATVRVPHLAGYRYRQGDILSPDGHCRAYDAGAQGTVFGSGVGVVVLKHVEDALADGDRIHAVIHATAVNNDGDGKLSYTASSAEGQARCMADAFAAAEIPPSSVDLVEGHGTGTVVGDPLEVQALTRVFGREGRAWLGSVKTNIGHLEQTAGVASLIKTALAISRGRIPASLHFDRPNPRIDLENGPFQVPTRATGWPDGPRRAAVNALGLGGTNAFAILEQAPADAAGGRADGARASGHAGPRVLLLSAPDAAGLERVAGAWRAHLGGLPEADLAAACYTQARRRAHAVRRTVAGDSPAAMAEALERQAEDAGSGERLAFVFPGQGTQFAGMGLGLHAEVPAFRTALDRMAAALGEAGLDLMAALGAGDEALRPTEVQQPAIFAVSWALAETLRGWGAAPAAVLGHSVGAFAAAAVAGIWTPEAAASLIAARARLMGALPPGGGMTVLLTDAVEAGALIRGIDGAGIAVSNAPTSTVIAGPEAALTALEARADAAGTGWRRLAVSHAFHTDLMAPAADRLCTAAAEADAQAPAIAMVSDMTADLLPGAPDPAYWGAHLTSPVRFDAALGTLAGLGITDLVEVGPGRALSGFAAAHDTARHLTAHPMLPTGRGEATRLAEGYGTLWSRGLISDPCAAWGPAPPLPVAAPLYPFARTRFWLDGAAPRRGTRLLGSALNTPGPSRQFQADWSLEAQPWLTDHRVYGAPTLPMAAALILLAEAGDDTAELRDISYHTACLWTGEDDRCLMHVEAGPDGAAHLSTWRESWTQHVTARRVPAAAVAETVDLTAARDGAAPVDPGAFYARLAEIGLGYGPAFRNVRQLWVGPGTAVARLSLEADAVGTALHPALLDAALHLFPALSGRLDGFEHEPDEGTFLPLSAGRFRLIGRAPGPCWAVCRLTAPVEGDRYSVDVRLVTPEGAPIAEIDALVVKWLPRRAFLPRDEAAIEDWMVGIEWAEAPALPAPEAPSGGWIVVGDAGEPIAEALRSAGASAEVIATEAFLARPTDIAPPDAPLAGLVLAEALSARPLMLTDGAALDDLTARQFDLTRAAVQLLAEDAPPGWGTPRLWLATRGAQAPRDDRLGGEAHQAVLWGHGRVIALEHPAIWGGQVDLDEAPDPDGLARVLLSGDGEDQTALRDGRRHVPRLVPRPLAEPDTPAAIDPERAYLITGGLGSLGLRVAAWLTGAGARHLWLVSRRAPDAEQQARIDALQEAGATVHVASADIAEPGAAEALIERITGARPLDGVFHAAGLLDDGILLSMDRDQYLRVTRPKIAGGWALHRATSGLDLGHFVLFSSILSLIGSMGQVNYVAANSFLDALVAHRRRLGLAASALNWGPWEDAGLATDAGARGRAIWRARGTTFIPADDGIRVMARALGHGVDHLGVTITEWPRFLGQFGATPPLYASLGQSRAARTRSDPAAILSALGDAAPDARADLMIAALGEMAAGELELDAPPDPDLSLRAAGLDSLMAITLINGIEAAFGPRLPARTLLQGPSVRDLASEVLAGMDLPETAGAPQTPPRTPTRTGGRSGQWLVTRTPRPEAALRLFCFPFAGGGSAVFDGWGAAFDPRIEIVAVEPPGRLSRIDEPPVRRVEDFARGLLAQMQPMLDRPYAVLGHCLGGLTLYETLRFLQARRQPMPVHIFVSGARPPSVLRAPGSFEAELEARLRTRGGYRSGLQGHEQSDPVFMEIVRAFGIAESASMLDEEELRAAVLPTVRAEFEMASRYMYIPDRPFPVPITCFRGARDDYVRAVDARIWRKFTSQGFELFTRDVGHFAIVEDFDFIRHRVEARLLPESACSA